MFGTCGGCALQHVAPQAQLQLKEQVLFDSLADPEIPVRILSFFVQCLSSEYL